MSRQRIQHFWNDHVLFDDITKNFLIGDLVDPRASLDEEEK
jgi:hypothetical protein